MTTPILRDRSHLTRLLLLRELRQRPDAVLRELAHTLDVTPQAVHTHLRALTKDGLVAQVDGQRVVTVEGVQALHEGLQDVKRSVDGLVASIAVVEATSAEAKTRLRKGDAVGLFMEEGKLVARANAESPSRGRALAPAEAGDEAFVGDLEGVLDLRPGRLSIVPTPGPSEGGSGSVSATKMRQFLERRKVAPARVGAEGTGARIVVRRLGWPLHFEFAPVRAAFHAAELGLDVALFVSRDRLRDTLAVLDGLNGDTLNRVPLEIVEAPLERSRRA